MSREPTEAALPFNDLQEQRRRLGPALDEAIQAVLAHGAFIMGPEVVELERRLSEIAGVVHVVSCSNGTDALVLALRALGVASGDAVIVPTFTFAATAEAVAIVGATPVFVDVEEDTFNLDPEGLDGAVSAAHAAGLRPVAVMAVDLFGQPAAYDRIGSWAADHGLVVIADAAQSFGAAWRSRPVGSLATLTTTSFFPAKPLGCYGDGGAVMTDDEELASTIRSLRVHGQGSNKYDNVRIGMNGRLDTLQAAVLLQKLRLFGDELQSRHAVAERYSSLLAGVVATPAVPTGLTSAWAQYTVRVDNRDGVGAALKRRGIPTAVYYPLPLHRQTAYRTYPVAAPELPVADHLAATVLSLPMHPYLGSADQDRVVRAVTEALRA